MIAFRPDTKILIREAARDWFEYGLVITEAKLVQAVLDAAGVAACSQDKAPKPCQPACTDIIRALMDLKRSWPYRPDPAIGLIHYFFNDRLYARAPVDYTAIGAEPSRYDRIFQELGSGFGSIKALREAEAVVTDMLKRSAL